jgi:cyclic pyranopterin phosphate synthase
MLSHIDENNQPTMVDVSDKSITLRSAHARATVRLPAAVRVAIEDGEIKTAKGPVFQTAIVAGTLGAKRTHDLIPFCHPIGLESCRIVIELDEAGNAVIDCRTKVTHKTGVEMEALTGASVAALTVYDMCKALSHNIVIDAVHLVSKSGGKSDYRAEASA